MYEFLCMPRMFAAAILCVVVVFLWRLVTSSAVAASHSGRVVPESVNYHFTRRCNYKCGFCFHTAKTSFLMPIKDAKRGLKLLKDAGKVIVVRLSFHGHGTDELCDG